MPPFPPNRPGRKPDRPRGRALLAALLFLLGPALLAGAPPGPAPGRKPVAVAMVLWRGLTDSEHAFMEGLRATGEFAPAFTILDAQASRDRLGDHLRAVKAGRFDLVYGFGTTVALALKREILDTPIVFNVVARPVEAGLIANWRNSGNNLTGISNSVAMESAFRALRMVVPFRKLGFVYNPQEANSVIQMEEIRGLQKRFGFRLIPVPLPGVGALEPLLKGVLSEGLDAVLLPSDSMVQAHGQPLVSFLNKYGIPTLATIPDLVKQNGAFVALGPEYRNLGRLAAQNALAVLRGAPPDQVPSRGGAQLALTVNLRTAKRLGLSLPIQLLKISELIP